MLHLLDQLGDLSGFATAPFGQLAHFVRDHGETPAVLARAGSLDSRVERQQIRLFRDLVNRLDHGANLSTEQT